jgi:hypothetical protein
MPSESDDADIANVHIALNQALKETNEELRSKATECEALRETVAMLARSLQASEARLEHALFESERLHLKLQAVCFLEKKDHLKTAPAMKAASFSTLTAPNTARKLTKGQPKAATRIVRTLVIDHHVSP